MTEPDNSFAVVQELAAKLARAEAALAAANASRQSLQDERDEALAANGRLSSLGRAVEAERDRAHHACEQMGERLECAEARVKALEAELSIYADPNNWHSSGPARNRSYITRALLDNSPRSMGEES